MAARKKTTRKKTTTGRRRKSGSRMGLIGSKAGLKNAAPLLGGLVLGSVGSAASDKLLNKMNLSPKLTGAIKMLGGLWLSGDNSPLVKGIGLGIASAGAITVAHSFGVLQPMSDALSGIKQDAYLSGIRWNNYINGVEGEGMEPEPEQVSYSAHGAC